MAALLTDRLRFVVEYDEGPLTIVIVESGDSVATDPAALIGETIFDASPGPSS